MDKTFNFKDKELRMTDDLIEIDSRPLPYGSLESVGYKKARLFKKGELRVKPKDEEYESFYYKKVINKQVKAIAERIGKKAGLSVSELPKKGK